MFLAELYPCTTSFRFAGIAGDRETKTHAERPYSSPRPPPLRQKEGAICKTAIYSFMPYRSVMMTACEHRVHGVGDLLSSV